MRRYIIVLIISLMFITVSQAKIPKYQFPPHEKTRVFSFSGLHREGISYYIYEFEEDVKKDVEKMFKWKTKDALIHEQLKDIIKDMKEWYTLTSSEKELLRKNEGKFYKNYKYYYEMKSRGLAYIILIWFEKENELHFIYRAY